MILDRGSPYDAKLYRMTSEVCYSPDRISGSCELGISIRVDARDEATAHASETCCSGGETRLRLQTASSVRHGASGIGIDAGGEDSGFLIDPTVCSAYHVDHGRVRGPYPSPCPGPGHDHDPGRAPGIEAMTRDGDETILDPIWNATRRGRPSLAVTDWVPGEPSLAAIHELEMGWGCVVVCWGLAIVMDDGGFPFRGGPPRRPSAWNDPGGQDGGREKDVAHGGDGIRENDRVDRVASDGVIDRGGVRCDGRHYGCGCGCGCDCDCGQHDDGAPSRRAIVWETGLGNVGGDEVAAAEEEEGEEARACENGVSVVALAAAGMRLQTTSSRLRRRARWICVK
ncbi:hypothetical protein VTJ04DRAFT_2820 [Mycothermus thermophilus]|uniref:uncharacterized protein n=1 Tax=Humicola insolens TaxID=85995 RepID=UPI0037423B5B